MTNTEGIFSLRILVSGGVTSSPATALLAGPVTLSANMCLRLHVTPDRGASWPSNFCLPFLNKPPPVAVLWVTQQKAVGLTQPPAPDASFLQVMPATPVRGRTTGLVMGRTARAPRTCSLPADNTNHGGRRI